MLLQKPSTLRNVPQQHAARAARPRRCHATGGEPALPVVQRMRISFQPDDGQLILEEAGEQPPLDFATPFVGKTGPPLDFATPSVGKKGPPLDVLLLSLPALERLRTPSASPAPQPFITADVPVLPLHLIAPVGRRRRIAPVGLDNSGPLKQTLTQDVTWGVEAVGATRSLLDGSGVKVAVLDTGLDKDFARHPAFEGIKVTAKNFTKDDDTHDVRGHGTHCLGTILGRSVNGMRIGVAPGITDVLVGKVIPNVGKGDTLQLMEAIKWACNEGANIINISLTYDLPGLVDEYSNSGMMTAGQASDFVWQLFDEHRQVYEVLSAFLVSETGINGREPPLIVAACGNNSSSNAKLHVQLPAAARGIVSVAAVGMSKPGVFADCGFSNLGATLCAPGEKVFSVAAGSVAASLPLLCAHSGTSMAAPHVTGVAALWWQRMVQLKRHRLAARVTKKLCGYAVDGIFASTVAESAIGDGLVQAPAQ